jgi:DNA-binding response OmpR family regulator
MSQSAMNHTHHRAQHIMVVDDEAVARDMVGDYLRRHGLAVSLCEGRPSMWAEIARGWPDLIVLDLNMPEEDGLSIIRDLKQRGDIPSSCWPRPRA